jgi:hypothetical protein
MRAALLASLALLLASSSFAHADGVQSAFSAVGARLQAQGGGLAPMFASCPKGHDNSWQYVGSALFVPISPTDSAVLVNTGHCDGGNGAGQYLVLNRGGGAKLVNDSTIGDMSFLATNAYFLDGTLTLYGDRWLPDDPHCCPSKKANLEFNLATGARKLTVIDQN